MIHGELPGDLQRLEQALVRRTLAPPPANLRARALGEVQRARRGERNLLLAAAAAVLLTVLGLGLSMPKEARMLAVAAHARDGIDERALERLGLDPAEARRQELVMRVASLPGLAPPIGSGALPTARREGL